MEQAPAEGDDAEGYHRRYELALDDVRDLKTQIETLQEQLRQSQSASSSTSAGGGMDWESQKRRILAELESDEQHDEAGEGKSRRLEIHEVVRSTEQAMADKEREIAELKQLLENQSSSLGSVAVGAAALGEILDQDALVREERENLQRLQKEWEGKLRQAEVEISLERAKIARAGAVGRAAQARGAQEGSGERSPNSADKPEKGGKGRWLTRLGLKGEE